MKTVCFVGLDRMNKSLASDLAKNGFELVVMDCTIVVTMAPTSVEEESGASGSRGSNDFAGPV